MKKHLAILTVAVLVMLAGCGSGEEASDQTTKASSSVNAISADEIDVSVSNADQDASYDESSATKISLSGGSASISGDGASEKDGAITIQQEGTYVVTGTLNDGRIVVQAADTHKVHIVLKGASIYCADHAALFIKQADKVFLTLADGSDNTLGSDSSYHLSDEDSNVDGVIFSRADLTLNGSGKLTVNAKYKHAIVSKDDLIVTGGTYAITAENGGGLYGKDCVKITGGTFTIQTGTDGIQASNAEQADRGYVYISDGALNITAGTDGIQADTVLRIDGGAFQITSGGGSANASTDQKGNENPGWGVWGPGAKEETAKTEDSTDTSDSAKGLKAGASLSVRGGTFTIDSSDDSVHCNGTVTITGGTFALSSGDDGIHADEALLIQNGTIAISQSYEGL
uniref:carbohydrate-binding domain-containing protein n=1 Tax=Candidatus Fimivicinus sp. TaxID=3056640 RepID=UPI003FF08695